MSHFVMIAVVAAATAFIGELSGAEPQNVSPCLAPSTKSADMLEGYRLADTTTDADMIAWRQRIGLGSVPVSQITLVNDTTVCRRAVTAFNSIVADPRQPPALAVDVIRYGTTRYIISDPTNLAGEWLYDAIVDASFNRIAVAAR